MAFSICHLLSDLLKAGEKKVIIIGLRDRREAIETRSAPEIATSGAGESEGVEGKRCRLDDVWWVLSQGGCWLILAQVKGKGGGVRIIPRNCCLRE